MLELNKAHLGDWVENSKKVGDGQINCVMTSPPYYALRDYGVDGQLGLEDTPDEFIENLCDGFLEIKRILRDDGSCWVNLGDTYAGSSYYFSETRKKKDFKEFARPKSQMLMPHRFAIGMVERGWILRNTIIWHKTNPMPESAKDRFTNDFEYLFFFVKSPQYYYKKQYEPILQSIEPNLDGMARMELQITLKITTKRNMLQKEILLKRQKKWELGGQIQKEET